MPAERSRFSAGERGTHGSVVPMERVCTAHRRDGQPCRKVAIRGGKVCASHGGAAPQVKNAAADRIRRLAEGPALDRLEQLIDSHRDDVALGAVKDLLDRAGYGARKQVDLNVVDQEARRIAAKLGIPVEQVYQEAGIQAAVN